MRGAGRQDKKRKKGLSVLLIWFLAFHLFTPFGYATGQDEMVSVMIQYHDEIPDEPTRFGFMNLPVYENVYDMTSSTIRTASVPVTELTNLLADPDVRTVERTLPLELHNNVDEALIPFENTMNDNEPIWNNQMVNVHDAWADGYKGEGISVAVFDSGFYEHDDIQYAGGHSVIDGVDDFTSDPNGHGTNVAGVIGAFEGTPAEGIAPGAELFGVKISHEEEDGSGMIGNTSHVMKALDWAIENEMDVINMSIGWDGYSETVHEVIQTAEEQGITIVASSGNSGNEDGTGENMLYPALYEEVIAVAALDRDKERADYSSTGPENELSAPGGSGKGFLSDQIHTIDTGNDYTYVAGTSSASPHVAGLTAILKQKYPEKTAQAIRQMMIETAEDLGEEGRDSLHGYGLVRYQSIEEESMSEPVLIYDGPEEVTIQSGSEIDWPEVTVEYDQDIEVTMRLFDEDGEELDPDTFSSDWIGSYLLRYEAEDEDGNAAVPVEISFIVEEIVDDEPPVIVYDGDTELSVEYDGNFFVPVVEVTDNVDDDLTAEVTIRNDSGEIIEVIDTTIPGMYTITYTAEDSAGNEAEPLVITVTVEEYIDTEPPVINYEGELEKTVLYGDSFEIPQVKITDNVDDDLIAKVEIRDESGQIISEIDTTVPGTYTVTYTAEDSAGNEAEPLVITVVVEEEVVIAPEFSDVNEDVRFHEEIGYLAGMGIINGYLDGSFGPDDTVTRAAAATMIGRALDLDGEKRETMFPDVLSGNNASGYIQGAAELEIIQGFPDGTFRPNEEVTRGQMAIFIARAFEMELMAEMNFTDMAPTMAAYDFVSKILHENITQGFPDSTYRPGAGVTRGQFSAFLSRTLEEDFR